ncbi:cardiolipin synthase ClsB, partial [Piscinibacter sakaiensis]
AAPDALPPDLPWSQLPRAVFCGGNEVRLLENGDQLFPAMCAAIDGARHEVWLATYLFHDDPVAEGIARCLQAAGRRGVRVRLVVDGFGSKASMPALRRWFPPDGPVNLAVFRPVDRWWRWLQPGLLRRLHQKLCVVDGALGFVGGINLIDDRMDLHHGCTERPRLDFAVALAGPCVAPVEQTARAVWTRAWLGRDFRDELVAMARSSSPLSELRRLLRQLRMPRGEGLQAAAGELAPVAVAVVLRDNLRQRRTIERSYIAALRAARERIDLVCPYFYPGTAFRRALREAAARGVRVRLLLQGKVDYRIAALAAHALYDELLAAGVRIHEYMPAFLHAKVALVDDDWATVGSSNIDPLSLLLNLEANVIVRDAAFTARLAERFDAALADAREIDPASAHGRCLPRVLRRATVAWLAHVYLRLAGATGRY